MEDSEQAVPAPVVEDSEQAPAPVVNEVKLLERLDVEDEENKDSWSRETKLYELGKGPAKKRKRSTTDSGSDEFGNFTFRYIEDNSKYGGSGRTLEIKSEPVKKALEELIVGYPSISFSVSDVSLKFPLNELWIYAKELNDLAQREEEKGTELGQHLSVMMKFLNDEWAPFNKKLQFWTDVGLITFDYLWTLFQPRSFVYASMLGKPHVLKLNSFRYDCGCGGKYASISASYIDYDGTMFGQTQKEFNIYEFDGSRKIHELRVFPLDKHPKKEALVKKLVDRGTKFVALQGFHCKNYNALTADGASRINTRVMIDSKSSGQIRYLTKIGDSPNRDFDDDDSYVSDDDESQPKEDDQVNGCDYDEDGNPAPRTKKPKLLELTDDEKLICTATIPGFTLDDHKQWLSLYIDDIQDIHWNPEIFSKLVLPVETKQLIRGLVESHIDEKTRFDDFVKGKGKGLIAVLHGPPGLGKTMTAETVAEYTKSPLYTISAGSLGTDVSSLERSLRRILDLAQRWKAVLLLDEADVYLEERSVHDIQRNALVSVFLRLVEYYEGILFLTTNRVSTFDDAFQSRIHVALRYTKLATDAREKIWRNFITRIDGKKVTIVEEDYKELAAEDLNGRQIKNAVRTALSIADTCDEKLGLKHLKLVFGVMASFERDLRNLKAV
ncbi:hypothetical protein TWF281_003054 [Arthrobotrys megalospora]